MKREGGGGDTLASVIGEARSWVGGQVCGGGIRLVGQWGGSWG